METEIVVALINNIAPIITAIATIITLIFETEIGKKLIKRILSSRQAKITMYVFMVIAIVSSSLFVVSLYLFPKPEVTITQAFNAGAYETINGTWKNIPTGKVIWVVSYSYLVNLYYPMDYPAITTASGGWTSPATFGGNVGEKFDVIVLLANKDAQEAINAYITQSKIEDYHRGIANLPEGTEVFVQITVTRN